MFLFVGAFSMPHLVQTQHDETLHLGLQGHWLLAESVAIQTSLNSVKPASVKVLVLDASTVASVDVSGAWLVYQQSQHWQQQGYRVELINFPAEYLGYFETPAPVATPALSVITRLTRPLRAMGRAWFVLLDTVHSATVFFGHSMVALFISLLSPREFRFRSVFHHVFAAGISATPIVGLIACLISIVITYQGGGQLRELGAEIYTVDMVAISVLRELGVLLTAIMVAGRSGSAFAAEIGLMKTNQEIDALEVLGKDPILILVVPRLVAMVIALPLLTLIADMMALIAAALIASTILDISFTQFFARVAANIGFKTFAAGLIKAPFFAVGIALIACWQGMRVTGSSESLGQHTTKAVVDAIFLVLVLDALFSMLFYRLGF